MKFYGGTCAFWYVSLNPLNESYTVELMSQREGNRKDTREDLARRIAREEGIEFEEAIKLVVPCAWEEEENRLLAKEGVKPIRAYMRSKPYEMLQDPSKDKHLWKGTKAFIRAGVGLPHMALQDELTQEAIDKFTEEYMTVTKPPSFNDSDHPLESGKQKHEEVKALKEKWGADDSPTANKIIPVNDYWFYNKKFRAQWLVTPLSKVKLWRDDFLTRDWNSLPEGCPFYEIGSVEFFELFNDFNPILMSICDPNGKNVGSLIASQMVLEIEFDWFHPTPRMKELIDCFKRWIDAGGCTPDYENDFVRTKQEVRRRIELFKKEPTLPQLVIMTYLHLMYGSEGADIGNVTIRDLKPYLMEKYPVRFPESKYGKSNSGTKSRWKSVFKEVRNWVPLAIAFEQDYKNRRPRGMADNDNLFDSAPSNVPDLS